MSSSSSHQLLLQSSQFGSLVRQLTNTSGTGELEIFEILDACNELTRETRTNRQETRSMRKKLDDAVDDLRRTRRRVHELNDELERTKYECAEWREKYDQLRTRYESLSQTFALAHETLKSEPPMMPFVIDPLDRGIWRGDEMEQQRARGGGTPAITNGRIVVDEPRMIESSREASSTLGTVGLSPPPNVMEKEKPTSKKGQCGDDDAREYPSNSMNVPPPPEADDSCAIALIEMSKSKSASNSIKTARSTTSTASNSLSIVRPERKKKKRRVKDRSKSKSRRHLDDAIAVNA